MAKSDPQPSLAYRPEIDGLRGLAILAVLMHHVDADLLPGGYVGVDVFFVISGYLITAILSRDTAAGDFSFTHFYARRARRLIPAGAVMAAVVMLICACLFLPKDFQDLGASVTAYAVMASNFLFWRWDDYFAGQHATWPLLHTWSLAVEEQFYLVFPWMIWLLRGRGARARLFTFVALAVTSFVVSEWQSHHDPRSAYYLLPSRAWELLAGGLCLYLPRVTLTSPVHAVLGIAAAMGLFAPMRLYTERTHFPGIAAAAPVLSVALLIWLLDCGARSWKQLLAVRPLVAVGLISYSLYLWHWPMLMIARYPWSGMPSTQPRFLPYAAGAAALLVAWLSYRYIETPGRRFRCGDARVLALAACSCGVLFVTGFLIHRARGVPARLSPDAVHYAASALDFQPRRHETIDASLATVRAGRLAVIGSRSGNHRPIFALWGDSHADALVPAFDEAASLHGVSGYVLTRGATPPLSGIEFEAGGHFQPDNAFRRAAFERIEAERLPYIVLAARWSSLSSFECSRNGVRPDTPARKEEMLVEAFQETVDGLMARGAKRIWIIAEVPTQPFHVPRQLALRELFGWQPVVPVSRDAYLEETAQVRRLFAEIATPAVNVVDLGDIFFEDGVSRVVKEGRSLYSDNTHLSASAARGMASALNPIFKVMAADQTGD